MELIHQGTGLFRMAGSRTQRLPFVGLRAGQRGTQQRTLKADTLLRPFQSMGSF